MGFVTKEKFLSKDFFITYAWLLGGCFVFALGAVMFAEPYGFAPADVNAILKRIKTSGVICFISIGA